MGLLHDLDWEEHDDEPEKHTLYAAPLIERRAVRRNSSAPSNRTPPTTTPICPTRTADGEDIFATEELTGLIGAAIVMRPSKSVMDFNVKSLKKKYKDKRFAAGVSREVIASGARCSAGSWTSCSPAPSRPCNPSLPTATPSLWSRGLRGRLLAFVERLLW